METKIKLVSPTLSAERIKIRNLSEEEFIEKHASGTLRKNKRLGMRYRNQYLHERIAFEFGWLFEIVPSSRITFNDAMTSGDSKAITEAGWFCERHILTKPFDQDVYEVKYIQVEYEDGSEKEGIGLVLKETTANWVPGGNIVFAIVTEYDRLTKKYKPAQNPS